MEGQKGTKVVRSAVGQTGVPLWERQQSEQGLVTGKQDAFNISPAINPEKRNVSSFHAFQTKEENAFHPISSNEQPAVTSCKKISSMRTNEVVKFLELDNQKTQKQSHRGQCIASTFSEEVSNTNTRSHAVGPEILYDCEAVLARETRDQGLPSLESRAGDVFILIDSFLDDENVPARSLLFSLSFGSSGVSFLDDDNAFVGKRTFKSSVCSSEAAEVHDGLFSAAVLSFISNAGKHAPRLAVLGELKCSAEFFGCVLTTRSSRYHKSIVASKEEVYEGHSHRAVLHRATEKCDKNKLFEKFSFTCQNRTVDSVSSEDTNNGLVKAYERRMTVPYHNYPPNMNKGVHHLPSRLQAEVLKMRNETHIPFRGIVRLLEEKY